MAEGSVNRGVFPATPITNNDFSSNWQANGQCYWQKIGNVIYVHVTMRNGTSTSGTQVLNFGSLAPNTATLTPIFKAGGVGNGYAQINTDGKLTIHSVTDNTSCLFDLSWIIK